MHWNDKRVERERESDRGNRNRNRKRQRGERVRDREERQRRQLVSKVESDNLNRNVTADSHERQPGKQRRYSHERDGKRKEERQ